MSHPAALGDGLALFKDLPGRLALELVEAHTYSTGAAIHVYRPRKGRPERARRSEAGQTQAA